MGVELLLLCIFGAMVALLLAVLLLWRETKGQRADTQDLNQTATALMDTLDTLIQLRYQPVNTPPLKDREDLGI